MTTAPIGGANADSSWRLKLRRAHDHFEDVQRRIDALTSSPRRRPFRVEKHRHRREWSYSVHCEVVVDEMLPVIIGEFLYDVRSALDHIAVVNVPSNRRSSAQFPIVCDPIWQKDADGLYDERYADSRKNWNTWTARMQSGVLAIIESAQPYHAVNRSAVPQDDALAILSAFQNADKHRELNIVAVGVLNPVATPEGDTPFSFATALGYGNLLTDGTVFLRHPVEVNVEVVGELAVGMTRSPKRGYWLLPTILKDLLAEVTAIIGAIEQAM